MRSGGRGREGRVPCDREVRVPLERDARAGLRRRDRHRGGAGVREGDADDAGGENRQDERRNFAPHVVPPLPDWADEGATAQEGASSPGIGQVPRTRGFETTLSGYKLELMEPSLVDQLVRLGLTSYEARAYVALTSRGPCDGGRDRAPGRAPAAADLRRRRDPRRPRFAGRTPGAAAAVLGGGALGRGRATARRAPVAARASSSGRRTTQSSA